MAGSHRHEVLSRELMYKAIREAADIASIGVVVFTGGEATLYFDQLVEGVRLAGEYGFVTRLVTNAWWASSIDRAYDYLSKLKEAGLQELNISFDQFHAPFLAKYGGFQNVINAASAAVKLGITTLVGVTKLRGGEGPTIQWVKERLREAGLEEVMVIQDAPSRVGRAANLPEELFPDDNVPREVGCPEAMATVTLHPNGDVSFCCGHIITLPEAAWFTVVGNLNRESLVDIIDKMRRNALAIALRYAGPLRILKALGEANPPKFYSPCEVCYYIATRKKEELAQLTVESLLSAVFGETWRGMLLRSTSGSP
jgi:MoaA/NifB/PqqE/SkfB family radical SAM enzyme